MRLRTTLSVEQKLVLLNSYVMSQFNYCSNVWMFHGKVANDRINRIHVRALRAVYNNFKLSASTDQGKSFSGSSKEPENISRKNL